MEKGKPFYTRRNFLLHFTGFLKGGSSLESAPEIADLTVASNGTTTSEEELDFVSQTSTVDASELVSPPTNMKPLQHLSRLVVRRNVVYDAQSIFASDEFASIIDEFSRDLEVVTVPSVTVVESFQSLRLIEKMHGDTLMHKSIQLKEAASKLQPYQSVFTTQARVMGNTRTPRGRVFVALMIDNDGSERILSDAEKIFKNLGADYFYRNRNPLTPHVSVLKGHDHEAAKTAALELNKASKSRQPLALGEALVALSS